MKLRLRGETKLSQMTMYKKYIKRYRMPFSASILVLGFEAFCDLLQPTLLALLIDRGVAMGKLDVVVHYGFLMIVVTAIGAVAALTRNVISARVSYAASHELRRDLFDQIVKMSPTQRLEFDQGTLMNRLTNDVTQMQNFVTGLMRVFLKAPFLGIGSMIMVFRLSPEFAVVFFVLLPIMAVLMTLNLKYGFPLYIKVQESVDALNERLREFFSGIRVVRAFNRFGFETEKFEHVNAESAKRMGRAMRVLSIFGPSMSLVIQLSVVYVLFKSRLWVTEGQIGLGMLLAFIQYMLQFLFAMMIITRVFNLLVRAKGSAMRVSEILALVTDEEPTQVFETEKKTFKTIQWQDVSFGYLQGQMILKEVNFTIKAGKKYGVIGGTGSGKSTLLQLLMGFYSPTVGSFKIDGEAVSLNALKKFRCSFGYVAQDSFLFSGTIEDNLKFGNPDATTAEMVEASEIAQIYDYIEESSLGFQTAIGRGGITVSGGQKQRLAIARALLMKPQLLILDDSTSALDSLTEYNFRKALMERRPLITTLFVSQRVSSIMDAECIVVLSEGRISAVGRHEALLYGSSIYSELYDIQLGKGVSYDESL